MMKTDYLGQRFNFWVLMLIGALAFVLYQALQLPFALKVSADGSFAPRGAFWIGLGIGVAALAGVVLPLAYLTWSQRISFASQFQIEKPRTGIALAVIAATFSMIPALELITYKVSMLIPPSEGYLIFLEKIQKASGPDTAFLLVSLALIVPFAEELLFRGFLQRTLQGRVSGIFAVLLIALLFGAVHPPYSVPGVILLGLYFGSLALLLENLIYPVIAHAAWNLANLIVLKLSPSEVNLPPESPFSESPLLWLLASVLLFLFFSRFWYGARAQRKIPPPEGEGI